MGTILKPYVSFSSVGRNHTDTLGLTERASVFPRCYPHQESLHHFLIEKYSSISHHNVSQFPPFKSSAFSGFEGFGNLSMTRVVFSPPKTET